jgi:hypothetical protein
LLGAIGYDTEVTHPRYVLRWHNPDDVAPTYTEVGAKIYGAELGYITTKLI